MGHLSFVFLKTTLRVSVSTVHPETVSERDWTTEILYFRLTRPLLQDFVTGSDPSSRDKCFGSTPRLTVTLYKFSIVSAGLFVSLLDLL